MVSFPIKAHIGSGTRQMEGLGASSSAFGDSRVLQYQLLVESRRVVQGSAQLFSLAGSLQNPKVASTVRRSAMLACLPVSAHRRGYLWGNFDSGSTVVRDETHPHYNSEEQLPIRCGRWVTVETRGGWSSNSTDRNFARTDAVSGVIFWVSKSHRTWKVLVVADGGNSMSKSAGGDEGRGDEVGWRGGHVGVPLQDRTWDLEREKTKEVMRQGLVGRHLEKSNPT